MQRSSRSVWHKAGARTATPIRSLRSRGSGTSESRSAGLSPRRPTRSSPCSRRSTQSANRDVELHLLGVTRTEEVASFQRYGVTSFDSTSPFRQAFKDDRDNFYGQDRTWIALRSRRSTPTPSSSAGSGPARSTAAGRATSSSRRCALMRDYERGAADLD